MIRITIVVYRLFTPCTIASKEKRCYCCLIYKEKIRNKPICSEGTAKTRNKAIWWKIIKFMWWNKPLNSFFQLWNAIQTIQYCHLSVWQYNDSGWDTTVYKYGSLNLSFYHTEFKLMCRWLDKIPRYAYVSFSVQRNMCELSHKIRSQRI